MTIAVLAADVRSRHSTVGFLAPVAVCYVVSAMLPSALSGDQLRWAGYPAAALTGAATVLFGRRFNAFDLFVVGFLQPIVTVVRLAADPDLFLNVVSLLPSVFVGLACAIAGALVWAAQGHSFDTSNIVPTQRTAEMKSWLGFVETLTTLLAAVGGLATMLAKWLH